MYTRIFSRFSLCPFVGLLLLFCVRSADEKLGSRKIFVDLGANDGASVAFFLFGKGAAGYVEGSHGHDGSLRSDYHGQDMFVGNSWELYVVEANNKYTSKLEAQKTKWLEEKLVKSYTLFNGTAIYVENGHLNFTFDSFPGGDAGSTLMKDSHSAVGESVMVVALDIVSLFRDIIMPSEVDYVVVKMDIEGAEFIVLKRIIVSGLLPLVDKIAIEWHHMNPHVYGIRTGRGASNSAERIKTHEKYVHQYHMLKWIVSDSGYENRFSNWGR